MLRSGPYRGLAGAGVAGAALALLPARVLEIMANEAWEVEILRFVGVLALVLAMLWPWADRTGGRTASRLRQWASGAGLALAIYVFTDRPIFLIIAFSLLAGGALATWVERAHGASQSFKESLERKVRTGDES